jgi:uncharacterized protein
VNDVVLINSPLGGVVERDGHAVRVEIYSTGKNDWILEVVDEFGNSTLWEGEFATDSDARKEFERTLEEDGIGCMVGHPA